MSDTKGAKMVDIHLRLYHERPDDRRLIAWLAQFDAGARGVRAKAIREALLRGIGEARGAGAELGGPGAKAEAAEGIPQLQVLGAIR